MIKKKKEKKYRKLRKRKIKKPFYKKKLFIYFTLIVFLSGTLVYFMFFFHFFAIKEIKVEGNEKIESKELIEFIENESRKSFLFLESKSIFLFIPRKVSLGIMEKFPSLSNLELSRAYPDAVKLKVKERKPIGVWCQDDCFLFDRSGTIYEETNIKKGLIVETENKQFETKEKKFSDKEIESIILIWNNLNPEIGIKKFEMIGSKINVFTKEGWNVYFIMEKDINFQLTKLQSVLKEKVSLKERRGLDYIDLRFDKRVYFK